MILLAHIATAVLVFFPAIGFLFLKSASQETRHSRQGQRTVKLLFVLQILCFFCAAAIFLAVEQFNHERVVLSAFYALYAIDLIAVALVFLLPESCQTDQVVARLLQTYVILFIFLFLGGIFLAPFLGALPR